MAERLPLTRGERERRPAAERSHLKHLSVCCVRRRDVDEETVCAAEHGCSEMTRPELRVCPVVSSVTELNM